MGEQCIDGNDLHEIGCEDVDWILLAWDGVQWLTLVNVVMDFWVSGKVGHFLLPVLKKQPAA
jgi:hypothetical protein